MDTRVFIVSNIKLSVNASPNEAFSIAKERLKKAGLSVNDADFKIFKRSVDARKKDNILFVYSISAFGVSGNTSKNRLIDNGISLLDEPTLDKIKPGVERLKAPPLVVGAGPAGLFSALCLAENGYRPVLIERGGDITARRLAVDRFYKTGKLDTNSNIQFGAGGAGTFSDGKLVTRINDPYTGYVMNKLIECGAPSEIAYIAKPHIGTDVLSVVVDNVLERIKSLGGTVIFNTTYLESYESGGISVAKTDKLDIPYGALVLAIGHSARDTYKMLLNAEYDVEAKPFSVGMRIEHLTEDVDKALYGDFAGNESLGHAEYNLSSNTKVRGVYTFCMCPGGEVVAAASEEGGVVVNGMSYSKRDAKNSNSAVVCSVFREDYGNTPEKAIEFQRKIERAAFAAGGGDYKAPCITVGDFLNGQLKNEPSRVLPSYMGGGRVTLKSPDEYLPDFVTGAIKNALIDFDKKISGFAAKDAVLTGPETRTSAPIRILRDFDTRLANRHDNVYPTGEGAGYAGGITSAAIDGLRTAIAIIERFSPKIDG